MHRFFVPTHWIHGDTVQLEDDIAHQIRNVLRMRSGMHITVLDNRGHEYDVELLVVDKKSVRGAVRERRPATGEPQVHLTLYQAFLKKDNFEWVLQKCTEVGVSRFVPVITERTVATSAERVSASKQARWERIIREAAEQCRRGALPVLDAPVPFVEALDEGQSCDRALIPWVGEHATAIRPSLANVRPQSRSLRLSLFIGPEGGFAPAEIALARERGIIPVTLGQRILRAETAAVAATVLVLYELDTLIALPTLFRTGK